MSTSSRRHGEGVAVPATAHILRGHRVLVLLDLHVRRRWDAAAGWSRALPSGRVGSGLHSGWVEVELLKQLFGWLQPFPPTPCAFNLLPGLSLQMNTGMNVE